MSEHDETVNGLAATVDYIRDYVTERADSLDFDDAVALRDACSAVLDAAKEAISLIDTQMLVHLEAGAVQRGKRIFKRVPNRVQRFRHDLIMSAIARQARLDATNGNGETSPSQAVDAALQLMQKTYLSPSTKAKVTAIDSLGLERKRIIESEDKGYKLDIEDVS